MLSQLQKILEADEAQLEELIQKAAQQAGPPDMKQFMSMAMPQAPQGQVTPTGAPQGLAGVLTQGSSQGVPMAPQAIQPVPQGLAALLQGGGRA